VSGTIDTGIPTEMEVTSSSRSFINSFCMSLNFSMLTFRKHDKSIVWFVCVLTSNVACKNAAFRVAMERYIKNSKALHKSILK
jgi:hypothetical protein